MQLNFRTEIFKEDDQYVALAPELNVSSFGDTPQEAKAALREAMELFLEECKRMGTLEDVLSEAGFKLEKKSWHSQDPTSTDTHIRTNLTTAGISRDRYFELLEKVK